MIKIYLEGAESTGKSSLSEQLADIYKAKFIPEYGRLYLENHWGKFGYNDIENIARTQLELEKAYKNSNTKLLFIDVSLINTRQWFIEEYGKFPHWIDSELKKYQQNYFLLCNTDLDWKADEIRSNPGKKREVLQQAYKQTLIDFEIPFSEIKGMNEKRLISANIAVNTYTQALVK